jgi:hypothetical protein
MNIKTLSGHLTANDKKSIKILLNLGLSDGRNGKGTYFLTKNADFYTVKKCIKDRGLIPVSGSSLRISTYISTFVVIRSKKYATNIKKDINQIDLF